LESWGATLPAGFALNRPRLQLTGLEEPEELWDRLRDALAESEALVAANKQLRARVAGLERQLAEAGSLTDDELVAELPKRMGRALESAQGVARDIVRRARKNEATIRQNAVDSAAEIVRDAEVRASNHLKEAAAESAARLAKAEAEAGEIVASARRRRKAILAELQDEVHTLQQRVNTLRGDQSRIVQAYDVVERTLSEARRALHEAGAAPQPEETSPTAPDVPAAEAAFRSRVGRKPPALRSAVYDWSPTATSAG
jgi:chaperonin cofactor prefoldin